MDVKRRRLLIAVVAVVVAALLPMYFFEYRWQRCHCVYDVCDCRGGFWGKSVTFYSQPHPIPNAMTHKVALVNGKPIMVRSIYHGTIGVFARTDVPTSLAWIGGVFVPLGLLGWAGVLLSRGSR